MRQRKSSSLVVHLKLKCSLKKPTHDDLIKAKEVYIQQSFGRYKKSVSIECIQILTIATIQVWLLLDGFDALANAPG